MLTDKQEIFCKEYIVDFNATQAAVRAGYSETSARQIAADNLSKHNIQQRIAELMQERSERTQVTADYVLKTIVETVERCKQAKQVTDKSGQPVLCELEDGTLAPAYTFDSKAVLRGTELLGKHLGMFTDRVENVYPDGHPLDKLTFEVLKKEE